MEVEYDLTPEDLTALQRYHRHNAAHRPQPQWGLANLFGLAVFGVSVLTTMLFYMLAGNNMAEGAFLVIPYVAFGAALAVLGMMVYRRLTTSQLPRQVLRQGRNSEKFFGWRRVSIDAEGIRNTSDFAASTYLWRGIDKIGATLDHAFFYINTATAVVVPCRAFADDRAFKEFVDAAMR